MLYTKYHNSRPCGFRQEEFFSCFPYISLCETGDPQGGAILWPQGYTLYNLGRGLLGNATYPNIKVLGHVVLDRKIFLHIFPISQ